MAAAQQAGGAPPSGYPGGPPPVGGAPRPGAYVSSPSILVPVVYTYMERISDRHRAFNR